MTLSIRRDDLLPGRNYIGRWCDAEDGRRFDVTDPATDAVFASVPDSGAADARAALEAAHAAFPAWRAVPAKQRAQILKRWNDLIVAHQEDLGRLISREQGKPLAEGRGEVAYAVELRRVVRRGGDTRQRRRDSRAGGRAGACSR